MKSWFKDNRSFIVFMCCFGFFRLAVADWNPIPSGGRAHRGRRDHARHSHARDVDRR